MSKNRSNLERSGIDSVVRVVETEGVHETGDFASTVVAISFPALFGFENAYVFARAVCCE